MDFLMVYLTSASVLCKTLNRIGNESFQVLWARVQDCWIR